MPPVLVDFSLNVKPGMKIGIVGREGAGKRCVIDAIFRFAELHRMLGGKIVIDGTNIAGLGLHPLRRSIAYIPAVPIPLPGSLKKNLAYGRTPGSAPI